MLIIWRIYYRISVRVYLDCLCSIPSVYSESNERYDTKVCYNKLATYFFHSKYITLMYYQAGYGMPDTEEWLK